MKSFGFFLLVLGFSVTAMSDFDLSAHRGNRAEFHENSLSALMTALETGASSVEFDVHLTKDGIPVIYHDYVLNPKNFSSPIPGDGVIKNLSLEQIKVLEFSNQAPLLPGDKHIPTLKEYLAALKASEAKRAPIALHLEVKSEIGHLHLSAPAEQLMNQIFLDLQEWGGQDEIILRSFYWKILDIAKEKKPEYRRILLVDKKQLAGIDIPSVIERYQPFEVAPHFSDITPELVQAWKKQGVSLNPWTVNDPQVALQLIQWGIGGLATDNPRAMAKFLGENGIKIKTKSRLCRQQFEGIK